MSRTFTQNRRQYPLLNQDPPLRRLKIEQSPHQGPQHWNLCHLPQEPMYQEAADPRTTQCCMYHPQAPSRHAVLDADLPISGLHSPTFWR